MVEKIDKFELVKRNTQEIIGEDELKKLLKAREENTERLIFD